MMVRVRFAPSPTGFLHLGSIRTALYNSLFAKKHHGKFILRLEDTDQERIVPGAAEGILRDLQWMHLQPDEGPFNLGGKAGPYVQSQRKPLYQSHSDQLIESGAAYRCFCSTTRLDLVRKAALKNREIPKYDNKCRDMTQTEIETEVKKGTPFTIRLKLTTGPLQFKDLVSGDMEIDVSRVEGDPILMKSDGFPTYHLANVVDDHLMDISHVLRGIEWQNSTPKHLMLFSAFGWAPPTYGHLPLILNSDGTKLSKRSDDIRVVNMREKGFFPDAILNYLSAISGGISRQERDLESSTPEVPKIYSLPQLVDMFDATNISPSANRLNMDTFVQLNRHTLCHKVANDLDNLVSTLRSGIEEKFGSEVTSAITDDYIKFVLEWSQVRINFLPELLCEHSYLWKDPSFTWDVVEVGKLFSNYHLITMIDETQSFLRGNQHDFSTLKGFTKERGLPFGKYMHLLRICLSNQAEGPPIKEMYHLLGDMRFHKYLDLAKLYIRDQMVTSP